MSTDFRQMAIVLGTIAACLGLGLVLGLLTFEFLGVAWWSQ